MDVQEKEEEEETAEAVATAAAAAICYRACVANESKAFLRKVT